MFIEVGFFVWCTLIAEIILSVRHETIPTPICAFHLIRLYPDGGYRICAVTGKSITITGSFVCIIVLQLALGIYMTILAAKAPGTTPTCLGSVHSSRLLLIPIALNYRKISAAAPSYPPYGIPIMLLHQTSKGGNRLHNHLALLRSASSEVIFHFTPANAATDVLAFLVVLVLGVKSGLKDFKMPNILRMILEDSAIYFLVVFSTHLVLEMTLLFARVNASIAGDKD